MSMSAMLTAIRGLDNEPGRERGERPARRVARFLARGARSFALVLLMLPFLLSAAGWTFEPQLLALAAIFLVASEAEGRVVGRVSREPRLVVRVAFRWL